MIPRLQFEPTRSPEYSCVPGGPEIIMNSVSSEIYSEKHWETWTHYSVKRSGDWDPANSVNVRTKKQLNNLQFLLGLCHKTGIGDLLPLRSSLTHAGYNAPEETSVKNAGLLSTVLHVTPICNRWRSEAFPPPTSSLCCWKLQSKLVFWGVLGKF
jgi:hypothetical protein